MIPINNNTNISNIEKNLFLNKTTDNFIHLNKNETEVILNTKDNLDKNISINQGNSTSSISFNNSTNNIKSNGIWIWNTKDLPKSNVELDNFMKLASKKGIINLYIHGHPDITTSKNTAFFDNLVKKASENNIKIDILLGNPEWINDPKQSKVFKEDFMKSFIDFWKKCPENSKPNLHLDIEPHCLPEWKSNKNELLEKTMSLYDDVNLILKKANVKTNVSADIPHWWDDIKMKNGKSAFENISERVDNVVLMSYGDTSEKVKIYSKDELNSIQKEKVIIGLETNGKNLIGWDNNDNEIIGQNLTQSVQNIKQTTNKVSYHPRPNTNIIEMIQSLPDK